MTMQDDSSDVSPELGAEQGDMTGVLDYAISEAVLFNATVETTLGRVRQAINDIQRNRSNAVKQIQDERNQALETIHRERQSANKGYSSDE